MRVRLLPGAETDLTEAIAWYEAQRIGLGSELFHAVDAKMEVIRREPERFERVQVRGSNDIYRRASVDRFPYSLFFRVEQAQITVAAVAHAKRRPAYWHSRIK